jgi:glyoxylase-like metal-dependent hydrolase (beta-lactamase superfamily II)
MKKSFLLISLFMLIFEILAAQPFHSKHFTVTKLHDGVYAAIAINGGEAICNAGIIDLGNATLIFDPFMALEPARELAKAAVQLTGHPVKYVVNSHFHNDHIGGDQIFGQALLISTERTRALIAKYQPQEIEDDKKSAPAALADLKKKNLHRMDKHEADEHIMWTGYYEALVHSSDSLILVLPQITFDHELTLHGTKREVVLLSYGEGHTESDAFLYLPSERIAFMGDLLFIRNQPWLGDGDPVLWANYLDGVKRLNPLMLIPGHGPVGNISALDTMKLYFEEVKRQADTYIRQGTKPEKDSLLKSPSPYDQWFLSSFYKPNVQWQYERMTKK